MDNIQPVVKDDLTNQQASEANKGAVVPEETMTPAPGSKTDSELLLKSLQEERDKRRELEIRQQELENEINNYKSSNNSSADIFSDEGKILQKQFQEKVSSLESKLALIEEEKELEKVYSKFPLLRENANDFNEYRKAEHPRAKIESVAKLFLAEKGLLESTRPGLERTTGGSRSPINASMTAEDVENLRKTNYREYKERLMKGEFVNIK
jgi:hypothetical protein